jgi:OmpA-OmpF porin, OOP family
MCRRFVIILFLLICFDAFSQRKMTKTFYKNGQLESKGLTYTYSVFYDARNLAKKFQIMGEIEKKGKEWKYWYQDGRLRRIENYKFIQDKNAYDLPDGKWTYYNEQGVKYREETYVDGVLKNYTKEIYQNSKLAGKISMHDGVVDTTLTTPLTSGNNLILNPDFDCFYYKPVPVTYNGRTPIDDWIPFWVTPGNYTPDYLSNLRTIDVLSNYFLFDFQLPEKFTYAGLGIYMEPGAYSEYIQGKLSKHLIKGHKYCVRITIAQPSYSGYSADRLGFVLSAGPISINENNESSFSPQVILPVSEVDNKRFVTLCDYFVAEGVERYISVGRFTTPDKLKIKARKNVPQSQFGINKSAYYLLDNIELNEIADTSECFCNIYRKDSVNEPPVKNIPVAKTDLNKLKSGNTVILKNLNFAFDSFELLPGSDTILKELLDFLTDNPDVRILISGHTDDVGTDEYNQELSLNRAKSVYTWLAEKGIAPERLQFKGFGKSQPLFKETDEKFRALNRRVEVKITDNF